MRSCERIAESMRASAALALWRWLAGAADARGRSSGPAPAMP